MREGLKRIPVAGPWITDLEVQYAADAAANAWYDRAGEYPHKFETTFAQRVGVRHAVSVPHATSAIHLSLLAFGIGPGDEVIVPDVTWIASAAPITYVGAEPVFADIDPLTWCLTPEAFAAAITPRTKAVIPVGLYGSMPRLDEIGSIADQHGIVVIEDAAEATGSTHKGRQAGSFGDTAVFSFHGSKTLATGEGGMLVTDRDDVYERVLVLRDHGRPPGDRMFLNTEVAYKYKMSAVQAALGLAQTERLDELVARKREVFAWYAEDLADLEGVALNHEPADVVNSYWMTTAVLDPQLGLTGRAVMAQMDEHQIDTRPFFSPLTSLQPYADLPSAANATERNPVGYRISPHGINLPSALTLDREDVSYVAATLRKVVETAI